MPEEEKDVMGGERGGGRPHRGVMEVGGGRSEGRRSWGHFR